MNKLFKLLAMLFALSSSSISIHYYYKTRNIEQTLSSCFSLCGAITTIIILFETKHK